jgi:hypothetical protein
MNMTHFILSRAYENLTLLFSLVLAVAAITNLIYYISHPKLPFLERLIVSYKTSFVFIVILSSYLVAFILLGPVVSDIIVILSHLNYSNVIALVQSPIFYLVLFFLGPIGIFSIICLAKRIEKMENLMNFVKKYYSNEKWVSNTLFKIGLGLVVSYSSTVLTLYFMRDNWSWWWVSLPLVFLFMIANPSGGFVNAQDQEKSTDEIIAS